MMTLSRRARRIVRLQARLAGVVAIARELDQASKFTNERLDTIEREIVAAFEVARSLRSERAAPLPREREAVEDEGALALPLAYDEQEEHSSH